jgi:hypothetical protein
LLATIPMVSDGILACQYPLNRRNHSAHLHCVVVADEWKIWGQRIRVHMREKRLRPITVALKLGMSEPALRSWLNGNREINLSDFVRLCVAIKADPRQMLFGSMGLSPEQKQALGQRVVEILETDTASNSHYPKFVRSVQKDLTRRKK